METKLEETFNLATLQVFKRLPAETNTNTPCARYPACELWRSRFCRCSPGKLPHRKAQRLALVQSCSVCSHSDCRGFGEEAAELCHRKLPSDGRGFGSIIYLCLFYCGLRFNDPSTFSVLL